MSSALEKLAGPGGPLHRQPPDSAEFQGLVASAREQLADVELPGMSLAGRFALAYNAAHALCLAALRRLGFRSDNRYVVFQSLPHTLGLGADVWRLLAKAHEARNAGEYHGRRLINTQLVTELIAATKTVLAALDALPPLR